MSVWPHKALGSLCSIRTGKKDVNEGSPTGAYPFFTCSKDIHASDTYSFDTDAIIIAGNGAVGETKLYRGKFEAYQRTYVLDGFSDDLEFIYFYLKGVLVDELQRLVSGSTMPYIRKGDLEQVQIPIPQYPEQQRIAQVLNTVQQAIEQQERLIRTTTELKQALMQKLFTEGLRGEAQKETEIGAVPESWEVVKLGDLDLDIGDGNYAAKYPRNEEFISEGVAFLRAVNMKAGRLEWKDMRFISSALHETLRKGHVKENDVILVTRGSIGQVAFVTDDFIGANMNAQLVRINGRDKVDGRYLYFAFLHEERQNQLLSLTTGTALQQLPIGKLKSVLLPVPSLTEQQEIGRTLALVETKEQDILKKRDALQDLFRTLLHELMTGKVRVTNHA